MSPHLEEIRRRIAEIDHVCSGTLLRRTKVCGKAGCACARNPRARHGPYYEWSRREKGRQVLTVLPAAAAPAFGRAVRNYRKVLKLLRLWERESVRAMTAAMNRNP